VTVHNILGAALYLQEQPQLALEHHLLCLRAIHTGVVKDLSLRSTIYRNLANDYWALNDMPQAIGIYKEALALLNDLNDLDRQAGIFWGMAMAYKAVDDWSQAKLYATRALHIYEAADNRNDAAAVGMNLAEIFIREERYADAEELLGRVRGFLSGTGDTVLLSTLYQDYADLARKQGRLEDAADHIAESIRLGSAQVDQSDTAGNAQPQQPIPEEQTAQPAQPRLRAPRVNSMRTLAEAHHIAALIEEERGHMAAADGLFLQALDWIGQTGFEETVHAITFSYAEVLQARGNFEQAMEYYRAAARSQQRTARLGN
jgi:HTH-type transcriptional regulator, quorum sensing regulator NprR